MRVTGIITPGARLVFTEVDYVNGTIVNRPAPALHTTAATSAGEFLVTLSSGYYTVVINGVPTWLILAPFSGLADINTLVVRELNSSEDDTMLAALADLAAGLQGRVPLSGGTMTGPLILSESPGDASPGLQAATKGFVEGVVAALAGKQTFVLEVTSPSYTWGPVPHGLGRKPNVRLEYADGSQFLSNSLADEVNVTAWHGAALTGRIVCS